MTNIRTDLTELDSRVIGRTTSFFGEDLQASSEELHDMIHGSRILVIGGAGSIGARTLQTLLQFEPSVVHVIDHNENGLAELVRNLRSIGGQRLPDDFLTLPFNLGGNPFRLWMAANNTDYDHVLNFAALKHVRTEKDPFSVLAMLETNVLHLDGLSTMFRGRCDPQHVFSVSTDKAANPSSMMGATKRLMEHATFQPTDPWGPSTQVSSARFANVAFSNGSLLQSWENRLGAGQPLACPDECRRFFVSLEESGHLCTLAAFAGAHRTIAIPDLDPAEHLVLLSDVAAKFLEHHGLEPHFTTDQESALNTVDELKAVGRWPVLLTPLDTGGEKPYEEFVGTNETVRPTALRSLLELDYLAPDRPESFYELVRTTRSSLQSKTPALRSLDDIRALIAEVEPAFASSHRASTKSLDQRM